MTGPFIQTPKLTTMLLGGLAFLAAAAAMPVRAHAYEFAVIEKALMDPYAEKIKTGCEDAAAKLGDKCIFLAPTTNDDSGQIQILNDSITRGVDGIAIAPRNPEGILRFLQRAEAQGISVITMDSDVLPKDVAIRQSFVGTDAYGLGVQLAKEAMARKPHGGTICIQSGTPGALNLDLRVQAVRDTLGGGDPSHPVKRLTGQNGWTEIAGCPLYNMDDITTAAQQVNDLVTSHPDLDVFIAVGGWAQYAPDAYTRAMNHVLSRLKSGQFVVVFGDAQPPQMPLLKAGLSDVNVGQNPYQIGYQSIETLHKIKQGKPVPNRIDTGTIICTPAQADTCGK